MHDFSYVLLLYYKRNNGVKSNGDIGKMDKGAKSC